MKVVKSPIPSKKWRAVFRDGTHTDFGAAGMDDFTLTGDTDARRRYWIRHLKDLKTGDARRAGFLSFFLLWTKPTLAQSLREYKRMFGDI